MVNPISGLEADDTDDINNVPLALRRNRCAVGRAIRKVFELAGIDTATGSGDIDQARALAVWQAIRDNDPLRATLANAGLMRIGKQPPKRAVNLLGNFIEKLGLAFDAPVRQGRRGEQVRTYRIMQEPATAGGKRLPGWRTLMEIADRRLERRREGSVVNSEYICSLPFQPLLTTAPTDALLTTAPATDPLLTTPPVPPPTGCDPALAELRILYDQHRRNLEDAGIVRGVPRVRLSDWLAALGSGGRAMVDALIETGRVHVNDLFVREVSA